LYYPTRVVLETFYIVRVIFANLIEFFQRSRAVGFATLFRDFLRFFFHAHLLTSSEISSTSSCSSPRSSDISSNIFLDLADIFLDVGNRLRLGRLIVIWMKSRGKWPPRETIVVKTRSIRSNEM